jgi:ribonuclease P/MRP protein subunit RPP40
VNMTSSLKPSQQCKKAARTAQTVLSQLARAFHFRDRHVFLRLYIQYVRPHLEYAVPAWVPWYEKVQRRAVRMISGLKATSYEEKLKELGISTLEKRRRYLDMLQTYKVMTGKDNVDRATWFDMASPGKEQRGRQRTPSTSGQRRPGLKSTGSFSLREWWRTGMKYRSKSRVQCL